MSAASASFKKRNQLRRAIRKGEGGRFPLFLWGFGGVFLVFSFLKIGKKYPNFGKNYPVYVDLWVKQEKFSLRSPSFVCRA